MRRSPGVLVHEWQAATDRMSSFRVRILSGFSDPSLSSERWQALLAKGVTDAVFLTWHWMRAWWETYHGKGDLLLVAAERRGEILAIAPLISIEGNVMFLGSGESDYLDFIGDPEEPAVVAAMLEAARERAPDFCGFEFALVPEHSPTKRFLAAAAEQCGLELCLREEMPAVEVELAGHPDEVRSAIGRSMFQREEYYRRRGPLVVSQLSDLSAIRPWLTMFYAQHIARWEKKGQASPFVDPERRVFLERFLEVAAETGWIRFLVILSAGRPIACEFAWYYGGTHYSGPWCFAVEESNHSPGHVLLRQSVQAALAGGLRKYDLGIGDQPYKFRLPVKTKTCQTWGLYPL
jgi:CelD/BcsL family acetyltransferase involved in cellulose biosynthesis